jgi:hypothetical protein
MSLCKSSGLQAKTFEKTLAYVMCPLQSRHVATCPRQSVGCLLTVEVQECIFHTCNKQCSWSNTTWPLVNPTFQNEF